MHANNGVPAATQIHFAQAHLQTQQKKTKTVDIDRNADTQCQYTPANTNNVDINNELNTAASSIDTETIHKDTCVKSHNTGSSETTGKIEEVTLESINTFPTDDNNYATEAHHICNEFFMPASSFLVTATFL